MGGRRGRREGDSLMGYGKDSFRRGRGCGRGRGVGLICDSEVMAHATKMVMLGASGLGCAVYWVRHSQNADIVKRKEG